MLCIYTYTHTCIMTYVKVHSVHVVISTHTLTCTYTVFTCASIPCIRFHINLQPHLHLFYINSSFVMYIHWETLFALNRARAPWIEYMRTYISYCSVYACVHTHTQVHTHTCMYTYADTYTHVSPVARSAHFCSQPRFLL